MKITVVGPNLADQSKGTFHVHAAGCYDLRYYDDDEMFTIDADSREGVVREIYSDHMAEVENADWHDYDDLYVLPCCKGVIK